MNRRRLLLPVGVLAAGAGVVLTMRPGLVPGTVLTTLFVLGVWTVALGWASYAVLVRLSGPTADSGRLPAASERPAYRVPGDDLADRATVVGASDQDAAERDRIRARVRAVAVAVLERRDGLSIVDANDRVDDGRWTDDGEAAELFTGGASLYGHVERGFSRRVERAADAVVERFERRDDG